MGIKHTVPADRTWELAELTILEIAKQSDNANIVGKVRLFKAFYLAHLYYASKFPGLLSEWPIAGMPKGPGIEFFDQLIQKLIRNGALKTEPVMVGPYPSTKYQATDTQPPYAPLSEDAISAIRDTVAFVADKTGAQLSDIAHEFSRSWNEAENGEELSIYKDLLSDEEHENLKGSLAKLESELDEAWGQ